MLWLIGPNNENGESVKPTSDNSQLQRAKSSSRPVHLGPVDGLRTQKGNCLH